MRSQFVLDDQTEALLNELSAARGGNRSFVVREAIHLYANLEDWLDTVEADPGLQRIMAGSRVLQRDEQPPTVAASHPPQQKSIGCRTQPWRT
jgi:predicted transcriptional regulator